MDEFVWATKHNSSVETWYQLFIFVHSFIQFLIFVTDMASRAARYGHQIVLGALKSGRMFQFIFSQYAFDRIIYMLWIRFIFNVIKYSKKVFKCQEKDWCPSDDYYQKNFCQLKFQQKSKGSAFILGNYQLSHNELYYVSRIVVKIVKDLKSMKQGSYHIK